MSSSYARIDMPRRSILFWAPVFIFAAVAGGVGIFEYGQVTEERERSGADHVMLAVTAMRDPADALQVAERQLVSGTIEFGVYRDRRPDPPQRERAFANLNVIVGAQESA